MGNLIKAKVKELNDKSRDCLCHLLLYHCSMFIDLPLNNIDVMKKKNKKKKKIETNKLLEFLSLFHTMVHLPDVLEYIEHGTQIPSSHKSSIFNNEDQSPRQRMYNMQYILLYSLGYTKLEEEEEEIALEEKIYELLSMQNKDKVDADQEYLIHHYLSAIQYVTQRTMDQNTTITQPNLDDTNEGGVTRVVSASLTDATPSTQTQPPSTLVMSEQKEYNEKNTLKMAKQTSHLENRIREKLKNMNDQERFEKMSCAVSFFLLYKNYYPLSRLYKFFSKTIYYFFIKICRRNYKNHLLNKY